MGKFIHYILQIFDTATEDQAENQKKIPIQENENIEEQTESLDNLPPDDEILETSESNVLQAESLHEGPKENNTSKKQHPKGKPYFIGILLIQKFLDLIKSDFKSPKDFVKQTVE